MCVRARTIALACVACLAGCEAPPVEFLETKTIEERLTESDIASLIAVLETVGEAERSHLPMPFLAPPVWSETRTLPVSELISVERDTLEKGWNPEQVAERIPKGEPWDSALKSRRLTRPQFCALVLSVKTATGRFAADDGLSLDQLAERGEREFASLTSDDRPFSSLTSDERHAILNQALWLSISDRATHLAAASDENVALVASNGDKLRSVLGDEIFADPFAGLYPRPEDFGIPFEEGEMSDAALTWSTSNADIGDDASPSDARPPAVP